MNDKQPILTVAVIALLLYAFLKWHGPFTNEPSVVEVKAKRESTHYPPAQPQVLVSPTNTEASTVPEYEHNHVQSEFLSPYHRVGYELNGDACKAPNLGFIKDEDSLEVTDFFELNITGDAVSTSFILDLEQRLMLVFHFYADLIGKRNLRRINFNMLIYKERDEYEGFVESFAPDLAGRSAGVYSHKTVMATVHFDNEEQALRTSIHEFVHALNHALIGATPSWLNEGVAEYFEKIGGSFDSPVVAHQPSWVDNDLSLRYSSFDFWQLANMESMWRDGTRQDRLSLYANSWHWIYFFMSSKEGMNALGYLMRTERQEPCSVMEPSEALELLNRAAPNFEVEFLDWEKEPLVESQAFSLQQSTDH